MGVLSLAACGRDGISKPDNLIPEEKMANILYDLYIIEGIRQSNPSSFLERRLEPSDYVYKKYSIDSLQFVNSDHWYAADTERYRELYKKVLEKADAAKKKNGNVVTNQPSTSIPDIQKRQIEKLQRMKGRQRPVSLPSSTPPSP